MLATIPGIGELENLPQTDHAKTAHVGQKWTAPEIAVAMSNNGCGPVTAWLCPDDKIIYTCQDPNNARLTLALLVGTASGKVITGYPAGHDYWRTQVEFCIPVPGAMP